MKTYKRVLYMSQELLDSSHDTRDRALRMGMKSLIDDMPMEALEEIFDWKGRNCSDDPIVEVVKSVPEFPNAIFTETVGVWRFQVSLKVPDYEE